MGIWREEDHPRGYHGHFISKVAGIGSAIVNATKAAGSVVADRAKQLGNALLGQATIIPAAIGVFSSTFFSQIYQRPTNAGAQRRSDYDKLPPELSGSENIPSWLLPISVETWNHILDGHAPESTERDTDKFVDGSTEGIVAVILNAVNIAEPKLRFGNTQEFLSSFNGQTIRIFLDFIPEAGKWQLSSVHPHSKDFITRFFRKKGR